MLLFEIFLPVLFENNENVSLQWIDTINRAGKKEKKKKEKKKLIAISLSYPLSNARKRVAPIKKKKKKKKKKKGKRKEKSIRREKKCQLFIEHVIANVR